RLLLLALIAAGRFLAARRAPAAGTGTAAPATALAALFSAAASAATTATSAAPATSAASAASAAIRALAGAIRAAFAARGARRLDLGLARLARQDIAFVDPDLDADVAVGRGGFGKAVVNIGAQGVQGNLALAILLAPRHLRSGQPARTDDADAARTQLHRPHDRLAHGALVGDTLLDLLRHRFGHQLRVQVGMAYLLHADVNLLLGQLLQRRLQVVHAFARAPDDDAGLGRVQRDLDTVSGPLDLDARNGGGVEVLLHIAAYLVVFIQGVGEAAIRKIPFALPVADDADPKPDGVYFLSQIVILSV